MSRSDAYRLLGVRENASESEIKDAYRRKVKDLHPDLNPDKDTTKAMAEINIAKEILEGKQAPSYDRSGPSYSSPSGGGGESYQYTHEPPKPPKEEIVPFAAAVSQAGVPAGVEWLFQTDTAKDPGSYSTDSSEKYGSAFVVYGRTEKEHVFAAFFHSINRSYYIGGGHNIDKWSGKTFTYPIRGDEGKTPSWLHGNIVKSLKSIGAKGRFNSKVSDLKGKGYKLQAYNLNKGRPMSLKNWLVATDEVGATDTSVAGRKMVVEIKADESYGLGKEDSDFHPHPNGYGGSFKITLFINSKPYVMNAHDWQKFAKLRLGGNNIIDAIFGRYRHGAVKQLTRMRNGKKVLEWLAENLQGIPAQAKEQLAAAAAQMK